MIEKKLKTFTLDFANLDLFVELGIGKDNLGMYNFEKVSYKNNFFGTKLNRNEVIYNFQQAKDYWNRIYNTRRQK